ncbi:RNA polymerase sigma factor [Sphingobacterium paludis]|uniref:RNA polymerase sigma-70 factor (ECF subfamily) n=1 Tax=Sphingobacterium paludis TaxID=1476465 RepID=A0A4R7CT35_9SPHI|nr:sigma-70 family RNA polymerase sigma factor [Sphingobacterium paludis]TDS09756.1 RNA polymerase sigma-70 factor (ECF subfamily) [Sphingobacterium paludis]
MLVYQIQGNLRENEEIQQMALGVVSAFNWLYNHYHQNVYRNIFKLVKSEELATELLQDVFLSLWQNRHKFAGKDTVGGWLFMVSYNKSLNVLRGKLKESVHYVAEYPTEPIECGEDSIQQFDLYDKQLSVLKEAVDILPARKKQVFILCRYEGRTKEDVAAMLGISKQSVSDYLKQSNKAIRDYVRHNYPSCISQLVLLFAILKS